MKKKGLFSRKHTPQGNNPAPTPPAEAPEAGYTTVFLKRNEIKTRQCVYISHRVHSLIAKLVRKLADNGNDITLGGYIDTVLEEHLQGHKDEINELFRQPSGDLL